jgi:hypothetical protein
VEQDPTVTATNQWTFKVWLEDGDFTFEMGMTASESKNPEMLQHFVSGDDVHYVMSHWPDGMLYRRITTGALARCLWPLGTDLIWCMLQ